MVRTCIQFLAWHEGSLWPHLPRSCPGIVIGLWSFTHADVPRCGFTATLLASAVPVAATNLVENGDFQTGSFSPWYNSTETKLIQEGANYYALLNSQLQQNMKVISGVFYTLSFDYIGTGNLSAQVSSGNLNANNLNATTWTRYVYTFTATSQKTLNFNAVNFKLDNITLVPGPIAGAGLPILVVFAGYAAWRRRQSTTAS